MSLLGDDRTYARWIRASAIADQGKRIEEFKSILSPAGQELSAASVRNVQYLVKFLKELSTKSDQTKMTQRNIAIVLAPTLLRPADSRGPQPEHSEATIGIVDTLIQSYHAIFPSDIELVLEDEDLAEMKLPCANGSPITAPIRHRFRRSRSKSPASAVPAATSAVASAVAASHSGVGGVHTSPIYSPPPSAGSIPPPTTAHSLSVESPSPKHKRKPSVRAIGKNFMDKIKVQTGSASSRNSSADGAPHIQPDHNSV